MQEQEQEEPSWNQAEILFGRLTEINRKGHSISIEYKVDNDWESSFYQVYDNLPGLNCLGEDHEFKIVDRKLVDYTCQHQH